MTTPKNPLALEARTKNFNHLLSVKRLAAAHVAIIGVGAVGRQAAIQLASMGIGKLTLVDFDEVETHNMGAQGWRQDQVGKAKVIALGEDLASINQDGDYRFYNEKFDPKHIAEIRIVLSCVDSMEVRKEIYEACVAKGFLDLDLFAEARMAAETGMVHYVTDKVSADDWLTPWYPTSDGLKDGCTTKSTIYCAAMAALLLVQGVSKVLRDHKLPMKVPYTLESFDMACDWPPEPAQAQQSQ